MHCSKTCLRRLCSWQCLCFALTVSILCYGNRLYAQGNINGQVEQVKLRLAEAHCGGWIPFNNIDNYTVTDYIPVIDGVPGREGDPFADPEAGLAVRNPDLVLPPTMRGFSTACRPGNPSFLQEHPCQRPAGEPVFGDGDNHNTDPLDNGVTWTCNALANDMNRRWKREKWTTNCPGPPPTGSVDFSKCYDVDKEDKPGAPPAPTGCSVSAETVYCCTKSATAPNAVVCQNQECRGEQRIVSGFTSLDAPYISYYRQYSGSCQRSKFPQPYVEDDSTYERLNVPVSCYGFYNEYDPYERVSEPENFSCVIANTYPDTGHDFLDAKEKQVSNMSAVEYGQNMEDEWVDPPPGFVLSRDAEDELWIPQGGAFALIDNKTLKKSFDKDITYALLATDNTSLRAYPQLTLDQPISTGGLLRAFDDTKTPNIDGRRYFTEWWQEIQTEMDQILSPPRIRLILPHSVTIGLDRNDPFITKNLDSIRPSNVREESVEILLQAEEDLLGELAGYLERSPLLQIQEAEVPIVVPLASPVELRALADSWCTWHMESASEPNCINAPGPVQNMRSTLEGYADYMERVRTLRGELYRYESDLLQRQKDSIRIVHTWVNDVINEYNGYLDSLGDVEAIRAEWQAVNNVYAEFYDKYNQPWCANERFLTPIYSQLDDWYPGRPNIDGGIDGVVTTVDPTVLPRVDIYPPQIDPSSPYDVYIDFSHFFVGGEPLTLPVLKPVQVRLDWGMYAPPELNGDVPTDLPQLPTIPSIYGRVEDSWPNVTERSTPPLITSYFPEVEDALEPNFFERITEILEQMIDRYQKYWFSLLLDPEIVEDGTEEDCISPDTVPCTHVEWDLKERFQRMCARPAVLMKEDFEVLGTEWMNPEANDYDSCKREDWACQLLWRTETYGQKGWALTHPDGSARSDILKDLRKDMFYDTLLQPGVAPEDRIQFIEPRFTIFPSIGVTHTGSLMPVPKQ